MTSSRSPWWMPVAAVAGAFLLRALGSTWRIVRVPAREGETTLAEGERCIFALWHSRLLPLTFQHRGQGVAALVSRHRDGEIIARIIERLGYATARGSSTRGGEEGLRDMLRHAGSGRSLTITPDGPRGPAERVKSGIVYVASRTGLPVIPVGCATGSAWWLASWDRFCIPRPFARVAIAYGPPLAVPAGVEGDEGEAWRLRLEAALRDVNAAASLGLERGA